jgi:hypothetical protein
VRQRQGVAVNHRHEARYCRCGSKVSECDCPGDDKPRRVTRERCAVCVLKAMDYDCEHADNGQVVLQTEKSR